MHAPLLFNVEAQGDVSIGFQGKAPDYNWVAILRAYMMTC